jgi:hypothetical protein
MSLRQIDCRDCERVTSGDCGKHGPLVTLVGEFIPPLPANPPAAAVTMPFFVPDYAAIVSQLRTDLARVTAEKDAALARKAEAAIKLDRFLYLDCQCEHARNVCHPRGVPGCTFAPESLPLALAAMREDRDRLSSELARAREALTEEQRQRTDEHEAVAKFAPCGIDTLARERDCERARADREEAYHSKTVMAIGIALGIDPTLPPVDFLDACRGVAARAALAALPAPAQAQEYCGDGGPAGLYTCELAPGHEGKHRCDWLPAGAVVTRQAEWSPSSTPPHFRSPEPARAALSSSPAAVVGHRVTKTGGDYSFGGVVVAQFKKASGAERVVVENPDGILHIFNPSQLMRCPTEGDD